MPPKMTIGKGKAAPDKAALKAAAGTATPKPNPSASAPTTNRNPSGYIAPARQGKKALSAYFDPAVIDALKIMAIEQGSSVQALATEALNDLFAKHGKPPIA